MEHQIIELSGIVRNLPDNTVKDGTMQEVINLRLRDGAWRPVGAKERTPMTATDIRYIHTVNETFKVYLGSASGYLTYWVYKNGVLASNAVTTAIPTTNKNLVFAQLHRSLIVSNTTDRTMFVLVFDPNQERYRFYDNGYPDTPALYFDPVVATETASYTMNVSSMTPEEKVSAALALMGHWLNKYPAGPIAIRYAWELTDGNIVKVSQPVHFRASYFYGTVNMYSLHFQIKLSTSASTEELTAIKEAYTGLIKSLNIYITRIQPPVVGTDPMDAYTPTFAELSMIDESATYLVHTIPIEKIDNPSSWSNGTDVYIPGPFNDIETRPSYITDNFTHHSLFANSLFTYNDRIFLGNTITKLSPGYFVPLFIAPNDDPLVHGTGTPYSITFEVDVHTSDGVKTVSTEFQGIPYYTHDGSQPSFVLRRYFAYPDARAKILRIYVRVGTGNSYLVATLNLTPHELMNFAIYNEPSDVNGRTEYGHYTFTGPVTDYTIANPLTINDTYTDQNRIQATEQSNPLYYPSINSYRVGNGRVLGMSSNAVALSTGQFGQFPLYCFTSDGIWALTIGTGDPLISSVVPVSMEVCNNPASITPIDGGTVFTTDRGLYILSGPTPIQISDLAEGNYLSRLTGTVNYEAIANNPNLYQIRAFLCNTPMLSYISGAFIGWDHINKEIVVTNATKAYSWVYSLQSKTWFKISEVWERFVQDFPRTYGYKAVISQSGGSAILASDTVILASDDSILASEDSSGGSIVHYLCNLSQEDFSELVPVHMETRPIKLTPLRFKKIHRLLINGLVNDGIDNPFSVNLFGSPDNKDWYILNASNTFNTRNRLLIGRTTYSCQYFILIIGGRVDEDAYFTHLEIEFEPRYANKLR